HYTNIFDVKEEVLSHMIGVAKKIALRLSETLGVTDINILNNSGARAGQSVMHFHIHIIPRYDNDNFSFAFKSNKLTEKEFLDLTNKIKF
ncbi:MAG: HIT family protein, partial [Bacilli bacterium]